MGLIELQCPHCEQTAISMSSRELAQSRLDHHVEQQHPDEQDSEGHRVVCRAYTVSLL